MELPRFKYNPVAYDIKVFIHEVGECSVCNEQRSIKYDGSFSADENPEYICPWCIENGAAAAKYDGSFVDYHGIENPNGLVPRTMLDVVSLRTPSYIAWQQEAWLSHCNEPCAFIGYADRERIKPLIEELKEDIEVNIGFDPELIYLHLTTDGDIVGYLFQCVNCGKHRLNADCH